MSARKIVGLDLSLSSTGVAVVIDGQVHVDRISSTGQTSATIGQRSTRLRGLVAQVTAWCTGQPLVVVEGPAYGSVSGHMHDRSGLWWLVVARLTGMDLTVVEVPPATLKKYALGKGGGANTGKDAVLSAVVRRYPGVEVTGNDEADALVLAAMGTRHCGHPVDDLPQVNLEAMAKVRWPW